MKNFQSLIFLAINSYILLLINLLQKKLLRELQTLRQYIRKEYTKQLHIITDGHAFHNDCISHYLHHAFNGCDLDHPTICTICENLLEYFEKLKNILELEFTDILDGYKKKIIAWMAHHARKTYLNAQVQVCLNELDEDGAVFIVDYKMKILPQSYRKTKKDFFEKRGWTLYTILVYTKDTEINRVKVKAYDH